MGARGLATSSLDPGGGQSRARERAKDTNPCTQSLEDDRQSAPLTFCAVHVSNLASRLASSRSFSMDVDHVYSRDDFDSGANSFPYGIEHATGGDFQKQPYSRRVVGFIAGNSSNKSDGY